MTDRTRVGRVFEYHISVWSEWNGSRWRIVRKRVDPLTGRVSSDTAICAPVNEQAKALFKAGENRVHHAEGGIALGALESTVTVCGSLFDVEG